MFSDCPINGANIAPSAQQLEFQLMRLRKSAHGRYFISRFGLTFKKRLSKGYVWDLRYKLGIWHWTLCFQKNKVNRFQKLTLKDSHSSARWGWRRSRAPPHRFRWNHRRPHTGNYQRSKTSWNKAILVDKTIQRYGTLQEKTNREPMRVERYVLWIWQKINNFEQRKQRLIQEKQHLKWNAIVLQRRRKRLTEYGKASRQPLFFGLSILHAL